MCSSYCLLVVTIESFTTDISSTIGQIGHLLTAPAVLHADIALNAHMQPSLKAILEAHRGDIEVIAQTLEAEVANFFHLISVRVLEGDL